MGVVYLATDTRLGRLVALKALPAHLARDPLRRERLRQEARAAAALSHPNIAAVHALEEEGDNVYVVSEFVRGRSLRQALRDAALPPEEAARMLRGIAEALAAAHAGGVVHRDLKPENVLLTESGGVKLVDFGLARILGPSGDDRTRSQLTRSGVVLGTPGYMAPEQLRAEAVDARADVFAWGVVAFETATGRPPFGDDHAAAVLARVLEDQVDLAPVRAGGHHALAPVIERCLQKLPAARFGSGAELLSALDPRPDTSLDRGRRDTPSRPAPAGPPPDPVRWWRVHQGVVALVCVLSLWPLSMVGGADPLARPTFFAALAAAVVVVSLRLNYWFLSGLDAEALDAQRRRWRGLLLGADLTYSGALAVGAWRAASTSLPLASALLTIAIARLVAALVIEPATSRAAFAPTE
jgi:serine/threonine-protein kinase